ncbi:beta-lactamase family protein (plasmid) [Cytobacillus solani]|uniref:serine hydrolase domain-containing protein n=1 Tax=Cytobacillus solani TaxID=1637975 RepID=UPI002079FEA7|nr:serine hydrolase [Cytobacillus solani]USK57733.1 beta-lactamase family protein [Cytobacillus solani]
MSGNPSIKTASSIEIEKAIKKEKINTCIVSAGDKIIFEYFKNAKAKNKLFNIHSVTKSIVSLLTGIAIDNNLIENVNVPISQFFSELTDDKKLITIDNLLTMSPGLDWLEFGEWGGRPFPMFNSKDWTQFILERKMIESPGVTMNYNSGCSHLLSHILQRVTDTKLSTFAKTYLFDPLEIRDFIWHSNSKGIIIGSSGLSIRALDMLKIGKLMLANGNWKGKEIISRNWISESTRPRLHTYNNIGSYGYHWWVLTDKHNNPVKPDAYFAMGYEGQYIIIVPELKVVTVFTSSMPKKTFLPLTIFRHTIFEPLTSKKICTNS